MKLLFITHSYYPAFKNGGPAVSVHSINKQLVKSGVEISVLTTNAGLEDNEEIALNKWIYQDGVRVKYFKYYGSRFYNVSPELAYETTKIIKEYDLIHTTPVWNFPNLTAGFLSVIYKIPYIISPRGTLYKEAFDIKSKYLKKLYYLFFVKYILKKAQRIHFTSDDEREKVTGYLKLKNKSVVIPNGLDLNVYNDLPPKGRFRERFNIGDKDKIILFLGRINIKKGLELLIDAFRLIQNLNQDTYLVIAGFDNEGYSEKLRNIVRDHDLDKNVIFTGPLLDEFKKEAFVDADVFVLPSYSENFGMAVIEAMACGCPVVVSNKVGIYEEIKKYDSGVVVENNVDALSDGILKLLNNSELNKNFIKNGKKLVQSHFDIENVSKEMLSLYKTVLN